MLPKPRSAERMTLGTIPAFARATMAHAAIRGALLCATAGLMLSACGSSDNGGDNGGGAGSSGSGGGGGGSGGTSGASGTGGAAGSAGATSGCAPGAPCVRADFAAAGHTIPAALFGD
jgi:hypothetical protein